MEQKMHLDTDERDARTSHETNTTSFPSRRTVLRSTGAAIALTAGCLGAGSDDADGETGDSGEPSTPWTTEDLLEQIDPDSTITIYASTGTSDEWYDLIDVINDEYGTTLEADVFASHGGEISQRFVQERQAGNDKADILSSPSSLEAKIKTTDREDGREAALDLGKKYFDWDLNENYWFSDLLPEEQMTPFYVGAYNGGPRLALPINEEIFAERGLTVPETYNDLLADEFEGVKTAISNSYIAPDMVGWIIRHHAEQTDKSNMEWARELSDNLQYTGASSHTAAAREVRDGNAPMMLYNWATPLIPFATEDSPLRAIFPKNAKSLMGGGQVAINKEAPNLWLARFFLSAMLEEPVQRRMIHDVEPMVPARMDLDYSAQDPNQYTEDRLTADFNMVSFWDSWKNSVVGQEAIDAGIFDL